MAASTILCSKLSAYFDCWSFLACKLSQGSWQSILQLKDGEKRSASQLLHLKSTSHRSCTSAAYLPACTQARVLAGLRACLPACLVLSKHFMNHMQLVVQARSHLRQYLLWRTEVALSTKCNSGRYVRIQNLQL
jgi:hypothetical protein